MDLFGGILIALMIVLSLVLICVLVGFDAVEYFRRLKHPKWYEHFDRATKNSFSIGERLAYQTDILNKCTATIQEAYKKGDCPVEEFRGVMNVYIEDYIKAVVQYRKDYIVLKIDEDLTAADAYAREHNLKWGILDED